MSSKVCIVGLQWGDEGKGKFVDYFGAKADIIVRFQGGNNAGHTIVIDGVSYKLSLLPSGILREEKVGFIGPGVVLDLESLHNEIAKIRNMGVKVTPENLKIADNIALVIDLYKELDAIIESERGEGKIGTTGKGISLAYQDKVGRRAIRLCDLQYPEIISKKLDVIFDFYEPLLLKCKPNYNILEAKELILSKLKELAEFIFPYLVHPLFLNTLPSETKILFEGAQGAMLDVSYGTYPFVTSSNTLASELFVGSGLGISDGIKVVGVTKAYSTRVGFGPFPTEETGDIGNLMREKGSEYGTVTGRKRRCGYLDLAALRYSCLVSGVTDIILTKIDVLNGMDEIKVCTGYMLDGQEVLDFPSNCGQQARLQPIYKTFKGWESVKDANTLSEELKIYINFIEEYLKIPVSVISIGAERGDTIILKSIF